MKTQISIIKSLAIAMSLAAILAATSVQAAGQAEKSLYERLGGVFAISAVVDHFSDALVKNPIVGKNSKNPALRNWHRNNLGRLPGLKFMRTLWVCEVSGGPFNSRRQSRAKLIWVLRRRIATSRSRRRNSTRSRPSLAAPLTGPKCLRARRDKSSLPSQRTRTR